MLWTERSVFRCTSTHFQKQNSKHPNYLFAVYNRFCKVLKTNLLNISLLPYICIDRENIRNPANKSEKNIKQHSQTSYHHRLPHPPEQGSTITPEGRQMLWKIGNSDDVIIALQKADLSPNSIFHQKTILKVFVSYILLLFGNLWVWINSGELLVSQHQSYSPTSCH